MATLKAMFKLFDGYSATIDKIDRKTTQATDKIIKASGSTDTFNKKLNATGASANNASNGLSRLIGTVVSLAAVKKGMDLTDTYVNTNARLNLVNDGLQTQLELQDKIFAAADRSKGSYAEMANAVAKMGLLAGDAFTSNDETIGFTELIQKSFKLGGAETSEQQGAMRQLTQAMASGRLQGDEYVSLSENAPLILEAISKYTGLSRGELKKLSSDGAISADIIKNAMFAMGDEIEGKFKSMPMTFGDIWTKIGNGATKAFRPAMESINNLINTDGFQSAINGLIVGINILANAISWVIELVIENWAIVGPILAAISTYYLVDIITKLWAMIAPLVINVGLWAMLASPIFLVVLAIGLVIAALSAMGFTTQDVVGFVVGSFAVLGAFIINMLTGVINFAIGIAVELGNIFISFANFFGNLFKDPIGAIMKLFFDLFDVIVGIVQSAAKLLDTVFGSNLSGAVQNFRSGISAALDDTMADRTMNVAAKLNQDDYMLKRLDYGTAYTKGSDFGINAYNNVSDKFTGVKNSIPGMGDFGTSGKPLTIEGKGKNNKVEVDMDDEDLKYLRDIAERDYINKFSTATLAPHIQVTFGDVHEEADANKLMGRIKTILQEEIATVAEGAY